MDTKNTNFDFVRAANNSYITVWDNRAALLKLALLPLMVKFGCLAAILLLGFEGQILRHGLVMLPAYFAEGFLIAYTIRTVHAGVGISADLKEAKYYFNDVIAAMIVFVLIQMAIVFLAGITLAEMPENIDQVEQYEPSLRIFVMAMLSFGLIIWAFRFTWLHVPVAMGINLSSFLKRIRLFSSSLPILGCWFLCFLPVAFVMVLVSRSAMFLLPQDGNVNMLSNLILFFIQGGFEMLVNLISAIAMSYGFKSLMEDQ